MATDDFGEHVKTVWRSEDRIGEKAENNLLYGISAEDIDGDLDCPPPELDLVDLMR